MIQRLPTNCRQKLFHLWARLHTGATINEIIPLNRAELCESVVFLHRPSILTMLMNDSQTANGLQNDSKTAEELPTKLYHLLARLDTDATINEGTLLNPAELCESVVFLHSPSILTMLINDSQTADELPTKIISFMCEAGLRRNHKWNNSSVSRRRVRKCSFLTQSKYSDYADEWLTDCRRITDENYFICGQGLTQTQP